MTKQIYIKSEERPFSEVVDRRRRHYMAEVERAFTTLYQSGDYIQIDEYEKALHELNLRAVEGNLVNIVSKEIAPKRKIKNKRTRDQRPKLDFETYVEARKKGLDDEDIKTAFRINSWRQLGGYRMTYSRHRKKKQKGVNL